MDIKWKKYFEKNFYLLKNIVLNEKLNKDEKILLDKLSPPPICMHSQVKDLGDHWKCDQCNLIAKKRVLCWMPLFEPPEDK